MKNLEDDIYILDNLELSFNNGLKKMKDDFILFIGNKRLTILNNIRIIFMLMKMDKNLTQETKNKHKQKIEQYVNKNKIFNVLTDKILKINYKQLLQKINNFRQDLIFSQ